MADKQQTEDKAEHKHEQSFDEAVDARIKTFFDEFVGDDVEKILLPAFEKVLAEAAEKVTGKVNAEAVQAEVKAYLDANLEDLVKAAMPPTPEQQAEAARETAAEREAKGRAAAARKAKAAAREAEKTAAAAAAEQAKRDAAAAKAFADAVPFIGSVADIGPKIVRGLRIDNGEAYSADHEIAVRASELEPTSDGGLLLTRAIELPGRGREFTVKAVSLVTDAGTLRTVLNGTRKCGGGTAVAFPARSLVFRPARASATATE